MGQSIDNTPQGTSVDKVTQSNTNYNYCRLGVESFCDSIKSFDLQSTKTAISRGASQLYSGVKNIIFDVLLFAVLLLGYLIEDYFSPGKKY